MDKTITLNEQQMNLLKEFAAADKSFNEAGKALFAMEIDLDNADYKQALNWYHTSDKTRERTAAVFAASVAINLGPVSHRGTEGTEDSSPKNPDSYMEDLP